MALAAAVERLAAAVDSHRVAAAENADKLAAAITRASRGDDLWSRISSHPAAMEDESTPWSASP